MASTETGAAAGGSVISLPSGGGAISGLGEKFAPDLFTGTGNFSVPISVPPGRHGLQPQLSLAYSTGTGNGPFGLGWALSLPGVSRKTSRGVPRYDADDVFIVSSAEDLVRVAGGGPGRQRYRPRTEGLFARIEHVQDAGQNYWEVRSKDGLVTLYGSPRPVPAPADWQDPATVRSPGGDRVCAWRITQTADLPGNVIRYRYRRDSAEPGHEGSQLLIDRIEYADYGDPAAPAFLIAVEFEYQARADPFSDRRAGFEVRTSSRCTAIRVVTHAASGVPRVAKEYRFGYQQAAFDGASLLTRVGVVGIDGDDEQALPPLTFGYSGFDPSRRRFAAVTGSGLPRTGLGDASLALVDLRGSGLPDIVELGAAHRYWPNLGEGRFGLPRTIEQAPPQALGDPGVRFADADGDGRPDLLVTSAAGAGYFPMMFAGGWSRRSFQRYATAPAVSPDDPAVRLVDLDGDGLTDVLRSGSPARCWFNHADPDQAWRRDRHRDRRRAGPRPHRPPPPPRRHDTPYVNLMPPVGRS